MPYIHYIDVKYNEHPRSAGHHWTDIIIRQQDISRLSYNDNVHHSRPVPCQIWLLQNVKSQQEITGLTLYYADDEHNNEMASFVVNNGNLCLYWRLIVQTMHSRSLARKWRVAYYSQRTGVVSFLISFLFLVGDVASAMFCSWLRRIPLPPLAFIASSVQLHKWRIWCYSLLWRGRCYLTFASSRHGPRPSFSLNKFLILTINITAIVIRRFSSNLLCDFSSNPLCGFSPNPLCGF